MSQTPRGRGDRGASTLEVVLIVPGLLLVTLVPLHTGLWWQARNVAAAAADEGARAARAVNLSLIHI